MRTISTRLVGNLAAVLSVALGTPLSSEVLRGTPAAGGETGGALDSWLACRDQKPQPANCANLRSAAITILVDDLKSLGSSGNFGPLPTLLEVVRRSPDPELRVAAVDGIGMIGPRAAETPALAAAFEDPVPAVRLAARTALDASEDERAKHLAGRAVGAQAWKSLEPERAPDLAKLKVPVYAGATPLRFATDLASGTAQLSSGDPVEKVVAFYAGKSKRGPMSLEEFEAAFAEGQQDAAADDSADSGDSGDGGEGQPDMAAAMAQAMAMMQQMNEQMNAGASAEEAAANMGGAKVSASGAANTYADGSIYGDPRVILIEEGVAFGKKNPTRYVVVYRDLTLGKTGIAIHAPPVL